MLGCKDFSLLATSKGESGKKKEKILTAHMNKFSVDEGVKSLI